MRLCRQLIFVLEDVFLICDCLVNGFVGFDKPYACFLHAWTDGAVNKIGIDR